MSDCWTPFRGIGAWRNEQAARKTLRLLDAMAFWATYFGYDRMKPPNQAQTREALP